MYNRLKPIKSKENEGKMGVVNLHRKEGGHFQPDLGGQYHRILQLHPEVNFKRYLANGGFGWMNRGNWPMDGLGIFIMSLKHKNIHFLP